MLHCKKFRHSEIWFLSPNEFFEDRKILLGICPECNKNVAELIEKSKASGETHTTTLTGKKYDRLLRDEGNNIIYKSSDVSKNLKKKLTVGFTDLIERTKKEFVNMLATFMGFENG